VLSFASAAAGSPVALVSGANRGIGKEIARQLREDHGFTVLAGARDPSQVESVAGLIPIALDVSDDAGAATARERIGSDPGRLDVLVNNAGVYGRPDRAADYDLAEAHEVFETNVFGAWRLLQAFLPLLRRSQHPRVVNVSSGAGQLADMGGGRTAYRLSKAALNALTRTTAAEEGGVLINAMCPGWVRTDMGGASAPRSVEEGADTAVWLATLPDDGPSGGFFRNRRPIPW
jgi:NAD(P)-dependent dehydrogenase (short-subunit alcohol dehydrogenase family)